METLILTSGRYMFYLLPVWEERAPWYVGWKLSLRDVLFFGRSREHRTIAFGSTDSDPFLPSWKSAWFTAPCLIAFQPLVCPFLRQDCSAELSWVHLQNDSVGDIVCVHWWWSGICVFTLFLEKSVLHWLPRSYKIFISACLHISLHTLIHINACTGHLQNVGC